MSEAVQLLKDALFLRQYGERPPGAPRDNPHAETWREWDIRCEAFLRSRLQEPTDGENVANVFAETQRLIDQQVRSGQGGASTREGEGSGGSTVQTSAATEALDTPRHGRTSPHRRASRL